MVALVSTAVVCSHSRSVSRSPSWMGAIRQAGADSVPDTQATSEGWASTARFRSSARAPAASMARSLRGPTSPGGVVGHSPQLDCGLLHPAPGHNGHPLELVGQRSRQGLVPERVQGLPQPHPGVLQVARGG